MIRMRIPGLLTSLLVFSLCSICVAQIPTAESMASVSGRVTIGGKSAAGITVVATVSNSPVDNHTVAKTETDDEGNYRLTGLAAGRFTITPLARAFVVAVSDSYKQPGQTVNIAENESIGKIDFALVRGGVITGRITDLEGRPIIGERVNIVAKGDAGESRPVSIFSGRKNQTDDRGVYRIYGLSPGSYKVSIGQSASGGGGGVNILGMGGSQYARTFYPGVTDESRATTIEINEGTEATNIDITPGKSDRGFSVSGRVIDADSGKPMASAFIGYSPVNAVSQQLGGMSFSGQQTDANGKFRLEGIQPGHYAAFMMGMGQDNSYSDPAPFDVSDADVTGIEIKVRRGATIAGVAIIENNVDPTAAALLQSVTLFAYVADPKSTSAPSFSRGAINADGSFQLAGLAPGKARINAQGFPTLPKGLQLVRLELDGLEQPEGIEVTAGAHIFGARLVFAFGTGKIRGEVRIEGGTLPAGTTLILSLHAVTAAANQSRRFIEVDARGHFFADDIPPATYELTVSSRSKAPAFEPVTRTISVTNGAETQVTLVINLGAQKAEPE